jgi:hypothetical protein
MDYAHKVRQTRGFWIFVFGVSLILIAPLPLKLHILRTGNEGNPIGLGLFYLFAAATGALAVILGCVTFTAEIVGASRNRISPRSLGYVGLGVAISIISLIVARSYLILFAA